MSTLFRPVAPRLRAIAQEMDPSLEASLHYPPAALTALHEELRELAIDVRAEEALIHAQAVVSDRIFAIVGVLERHLGGPLTLEPDDVVRLHYALIAWAERLEHQAEAAVDGWEPG